MTHEKNSPPPAADILHLSNAFLLKLRVANSQHFIDDQDLRLQMRRHRERQAHIHAAAVPLHRRVDKFFHSGKSHDLVKFLFYLRLVHPEDGPVEKNIVPPAEFRIKPGADFEQTGNTALDPHFPEVGAVTRERILRSVVLPAPLRPTIPKTSPCFTSKFTSSRALKLCPTMRAWLSLPIFAVGSGLPQALAHIRETSSTRVASA